MKRNFPFTALIIPAIAAVLIVAVTFISHDPQGVVGKTMHVGDSSIRLPKNFVMDIGGQHQRPALRAKIEKLLKEGGKTALNLIEPDDANATQFLGATNTVTPGANINLQLATPQASAAYVACNMALSPICRIYVNAAISTLAIYNGVDGADYTVEIVQDNSGHSVAVPTAGGTPAGITTQVAGWDVGTAPINAAVAAPTQQAGAIITWKMIYDSTAGAFIVYSVN